MTDKVLKWLNDYEYLAMWFEFAFVVFVFVLFELRTILSNKKREKEKDVIHKLNVLAKTVMSIYQYNYLNKKEEEDIKDKKFDDIFVNTCAENIPSDFKRLIVEDYFIDDVKQLSELYGAPIDRSFIIERLVDFYKKSEADLLFLDAGIKIAKKCFKREKDITTIYNNVIKDVTKIFGK